MTGWCYRLWFALPIPLHEELQYLTENRGVDSGHRNGNKPDHRFVVDLASKAISLTHQTGVHKKAIAYATPYVDELTLEESVDPTTELISKVYSSIKFWNMRLLTYVE